MTPTLLIDGSRGEGGGQILRTSLSLSILTQTPFRITNIRANRDPAGLRRQHLTAVTSAAAICNAQLTGAHVDSRDLTFVPHPVTPGNYTFDVGSAGSTNLVLQTVLPPLLLAGAPSQLKLVGGTHNIYAPPFDFLHQTFLPLLNRTGPTVDLRLERAGFFPRGGGIEHVTITPHSTGGGTSVPSSAQSASSFNPRRSAVQPLHLHDRGPLLHRRARAVVAGLRRDIADRELATIRDSTDFTPAELEPVELPPDQGPGNIVTIALAYQNLTEVFTGYGERGTPAERVAQQAVDQMNRYLATDAPVGDCLADQLLLPLALAGSGSYTTGPLTRHTQTNIDTIRLFLPHLLITTEPHPDGRVTLHVAS